MILFYTRPDGKPDSTFPACSTMRISADMAKKARKKTRRSKKKTPGIITRALSSVAGFVARHPSWVAGPLAFGVVFSFVSANALWYQPGPHPEPLLQTRLPARPYAVPGQRPPGSDESYQSFRIEREEDLAEADPAQADEQPHDLMALLESVQQSAPTAADLPEKATPPPVSVESIVTVPQPVEGNPIMQAQTALAALGYYTAAPDGLDGPMTRAAIAGYQADKGLEQTGVADAATLAALQGADPAMPPVPQPRPEQRVAATPAPSEPADPVAALLDSETTASVEAVANPMIVEIQRGLVNIAYEGITVDGVAGSKTHEAILQFQKHYRLPQDGEPSVAVLDKLKEIGAL